MRRLLSLFALMPLAACSFEGGDRSPLSENETAQRPDVSTINFGEDSGDFTNDDECDDPRFKGPGMTSTPLMEEDELADASDCRAAYERGELALIP